MRIRYTNTHTIADVYELDVPDDELNPDGAFDLSTAQGREDAMNDWADWQGGDPFFQTEPVWSEVLDLIDERYGVVEDE